VKVIGFSMTTPTPRKHQPHWKDSTRTARSTKRTNKDNEWAARISDGKYPTLRKLMTAIHTGKIVILKNAVLLPNGDAILENVELRDKKGTLITEGTSTLEIRGEEPLTFRAVAFKKVEQS
jgi:hypothetical protein